MNFAEYGDTLVVRASPLRILTLLLLVCPLALGAELKLFHRGKLHPDYDAIVRHIGPGDVLEFSDGEKFKVVSVLGSGNLNLILDIGNGEVLRIPLGKDAYVNENGDRFDYRDSITQFIKGAKRLERNGVPVVKVNFQKSVKGERVISEKLDIKFTFEQFTERMKASPDDPELLKAYGAFKEFVKKSAMVTEVHDLHADNLVYTSQGWRAMDFLDTVTKYRGDGIGRFKTFEFLLHMEDVLPLYFMPGLRHAYERLPAERRIELNDIIEQERSARSGFFRRVSSTCALVWRFVFRRGQR